VTATFSLSGLAINAVPCSIAVQRIGGSEGSFRTEAARKRPVPSSRKTGKAGLSAPP
jgi:hypothetical protein